MIETEILIGDLNKLRQIEAVALGRLDSAHATNEGHLSTWSPQQKASYASDFAIVSDIKSLRTRIDTFFTTDIATVLSAHEAILDE